MSKHTLYYKVVEHSPPPPLITLFVFLFRQPTVTGTSVLAIKYKDGVMMAADCLGTLSLSFVTIIITITIVTIIITITTV